MAVSAAGWRAIPGGVEIPVRVRTGAPAEAVGGRHGDALKVAVTAPPVDGRANDAVVRAVARALRVPPSAVTLVAGAKSRDKNNRGNGADEARRSRGCCDLHDSA